MANPAKSITPKIKKTHAPAKAPAAPDAATVAARAGTADAHPARPDPKGKLGALIALLRRPDGAQIPDIMAATGWQAHSVRGAMSGALKKKLGLTITSAKTEAGRTYQITAPGAGAAE